MRKHRDLLWAGCFVLWVVISLSYLVYQRYESQSQKDLGVRAVKLLYEFHNLDQIDSNMQELKKICTTEVYDSLTIDQTERVFSVWLKFKGNPTSVNVIESSVDHVVYSLNTPNVKAYRRFIFSYSTMGGKISSCAEAEMVVFPTSQRWLTE